MDRSLSHQRQPGYNGLVVPTPPDPEVNPKATRRTFTARQAEERLLAGEAWNDNGLVFTTKTGAPLELRNLLQRGMRPLLTKAGLSSEFDLYSRRHTAISLALAEGVDVKSVSERAGHASAAFTLDRYGHVMPSQQTRAADAQGRALYRR